MRAALYCNPLRSQLINLPLYVTHRPFLHATILEYLARIDPVTLEKIAQNRCSPRLVRRITVMPILLSDICSVGVIIDSFTSEDGHIDVQEECQIFVRGTVGLRG